jgi:hypothetical protein
LGRSASKKIDSLTYDNPFDFLRQERLRFKEEDQENDDAPSLGRRFKNHHFVHERSLVY